MSQEIRQKANRDACAGLVRQAHQELTKLHQDTQDTLGAIAHAMKLVGGALALAEAQRGVGIVESERSGCSRFRR